MQRSLAVMAAALAASLSAAPAGACGVWSLQDQLSNAAVTFYIHTVLTRPPLEKKRRTVLRITDATVDADPLALPDTPVLLDSVKTQDGSYSFSGAELRVRGRAAGRLEGETLTVGERSYRIVMQLLAEDYHGMPMWAVEVTHDGRRVLDGKATHLCGGGPTELVAKTERMELTRRRIAIYLAWRQLEGERAAPAKAAPR